VWRAFAAQDTYRACGPEVPVLFVYTREAHASDDFPTPVNASGPMALTEGGPTQHRSLSARLDAARRATGLLEDQLGLLGESADETSSQRIHLVADALDDALEAAYEARPFRLYLVDLATRKVVFAAGLGPFNVAQKVNAIEATVAQLAGK